MMEAANERGASADTLTPRVTSQESRRAPNTSGRPIAQQRWPRPVDADDFDPLRWLGDWHAAGGQYTIGSDGKAWLFTPLDGWEAIRPLHDALFSSDDRRDAVRAIASMYPDTTPADVPTKPSRANDIIDTLDDVACILEEAGGILDTLANAHCVITDSRPLDACEVRALYGAIRLVTSAKEQAGDAGASLLVAGHCAA